MAYTAAEPRFLMHILFLHYLKLSNKILVQIKQIILQILDKLLRFLLYSFFCILQITVLQTELRGRGEFIRIDIIN